MRAAWLAVALLLAGCTAEDPAAPAATAQDGAGSAQPPAAPGGATGAVAGVVVDESRAPLADAQVLVDGAPVAVTDGAGFFAAAGVPVGSRVVSAQREGHFGASQGVVVVAGGESRVELVLARLPDHSAHVETHEFNGWITCAATAPRAGEGPTPFVSRPCTASDLPGGPPPDPNTKDRFVFPVAGETRGLVLEMTWEASTPATRKMQLRFEKAGEEAIGGARIRIEEGTSPLVVRVEGDVVPREPGDYQVSVVVGEQEPGAAVNQPFTVYVSVFHWEPPPDGYSIALGAAA